jgi:peptide/nickel transport system permease protein
MAVDAKADEARAARRRWRNYPPLVLACIAFLALVLIAAAGADLLAPKSYTAQDLLNRLKPPAFLGGPAQYLLGTDELGRDMLSRLLYGIRVSVIVAILGTAIGALLGTFLGFVAAHSRGLVEESIMMLVDVQAAVPFLIIALAVLAFFGNSLTLFIIIMGINGWENYARLTRGMVLSAATHGYAVAVRSLGAKPLRIYGRHILPNIASALIVQFTLNFPSTILLETSLSFLGLGIQPPDASWGVLLEDGSKAMQTYPWLLLYPGLFFSATLLALNILGDGLRDACDPKSAAQE